MARIDELAGKIEAARGLRRSVANDAKTFLASAYLRIVEDAEWHPMGEVAPIVRRPIQVEPFTEYRELGIRSFGKGTFHKEPVLGMNLGGKRLFCIEPGDLVLSNVFAWEGAVAVARPEDAGRVGSHRFITCVAGPSAVTPSFLWFHFLTPKGLDQLGDASPGGAGRNRTLGLQALERIEVPVPPIEAQRWFDGLQYNFSQISDIRAETQADLDALLPAILDRAFRGEL